MATITKYLVYPHDLLLDVLKKIDLGAKGVVVVVDSNQNLLGIVTDGDVRRFILSKGKLDSTISTIYNKNPKYAFINGTLSYFEQLMYKHGINALPLVDAELKVLDIIFLEDILFNKNEYKSLSNTILTDVPIVIMAGGNGTRLYPYTRILPKPLIPIGDKPISERIIDQFVKFGSTQFYFSVNYKANMIKAYYNDLDKDYVIEYIKEDQPLGTGGSLYLLKNSISKTFFVVNCDIIINADYCKMYEFHKDKKNQITVISAVKNYQIPYGVIEVDGCDSSLQQIIEKPTYNFLVNTGMYILEPEVLKLIPKNKFYHITTLIEDLIKLGGRVGVYPVHGDSWLDMGQFEEMKEMLDKLGLN